MTISTTQNIATWGGNGSTTVFSAAFVADSASDLIVQYTNSSGIISTLLPSTYSIMLNPVGPGQLWSTGFTLTYPLTGSPIAGGTSLTVSRILPLTQETSLSDQGNYTPEIIEQALDTLCMEIQQLSSRTGKFWGNWQTDFYYNYSDTVIDGPNGNNSGNVYMCVIANTSGTWSTDLANGYWVLAIQVSIGTTPLPLSIANGGTGQVTSAAALTALGGVGLSSSNTFTAANSFTGGSITVPTRSASDSSANAASTAFVNGTALTLANGTTATTQSSSDNTTKVATTAFVQTAIGGSGSAIKSIHVQSFTITGTYTPSAGMAYAIIEMVGGGGGGGGVGTVFGNGAGGGAGAYIKALETAAQIGSSQTITVGGAGSAGANTGATGGNGGTTSVGSLLSTTGGHGGAYTAASGFAAGGAGGASTVTTGTAILSMSGQAGQGAGTNTGGGISGNGADTLLGIGGLGPQPLNGFSEAGVSATGYGAGGSGAINQSNATAEIGGAGAPGYVVITEYCTE